MKKKTKKINKKRILILLIIIIVICICIKNNLFNDVSSNLDTSISKIADNSEYKTIKQDTNDNYSGIGQEKVKNKDGYFTTFTTMQDHQKKYIEYKQNNNSSWSNKQYWGGTMSENGCGITCY